MFSLVVNDPDESFLANKEISLVTDTAEWRYWISKGKCKKPELFDVLTPAGDVILKPNSEIELLFKFLTLRDFTSHPLT